MTTPIDYRLLLVPPGASLKRVMEVMTVKTSAGMVMVVDRRGRLLGVAVDSDIRKGLLRGATLETKVSEVMNRRPKTLPHRLGEPALREAFLRDRVASIPLVDARGCVRGFAQLADFAAAPSERPNAVVLLAGGRGLRLRPLTEDRPKPLLPVGNKPILETIVEQFVAAGFRRLFLSVSHQADQIQAHFGDGSPWKASIRYIRESKPLGTAGPLSLLPVKPQAPILVMNADLLTKVDFNALLDFHQAEGALATVCVREFDIQIPYGVVEMAGHHLERIVEKPTQRFFVNAGIYVLSPKALASLRRGTRLDMPELLERLRRRSRRAVGCFPVSEYWIDIGKMDDYKRAGDDYPKVFGR